MSFSLLQLSSTAAQNWVDKGAGALLLAALVFVVLAFTLGESIFFGLVPASTYKRQREDYERRLDTLRAERDAARTKIEELYEEKIEIANRSAKVAEAFVGIMENSKR